MNSDALRAEVRHLIARHAKPATGASADAAAQAVIAVMQRFETAYLASDVDASIACFAPDCEWRLPAGRVLRGRAEVAEFLKSRFTDPSSPHFSDSRVRVLGDTVIQNYRVSVQRGGGATSELEGCDVYRFRDGLILHKDAYWKQLPAAAPTGLAVPLVVSCAGDVARLGDMLNRLLASALADAATQGGLRFELRVQPGASACRCEGADAHAAPSAPVEAVRAAALLRGVVTERDIKALPAGCQVVGAAAGAVLTPLARDTLRQRGIELHKAEER